MSHHRDMISCLPLLYQDGKTIGSLLMQPAIQLEIADEIAREIAQSHWFDAAVERKDVAKLAKILDIEIEDWQSIDEFRAWVHSLRNAWLYKTGTTTVPGLKNFVTEYCERYQKAVGIHAVQPITAWSETPHAKSAAFIENPLHKKIVHLGASGTQPLQNITLSNNGLDHSPARLFIKNISDEFEYVPLIANITSSQALIFTGKIPPGKRLWIGEKPGTTDVFAVLEDREVSDQVVSIENFTPGTVWDTQSITSPAQVLTIEKGDNVIWFFPCALYDKQGLDRYLSTLASLTVTQGVYDTSKFDHALFWQDALVTIDIGFEETQPAQFSIQLPAGAMSHKVGKIDQVLTDRETLLSSLNSGVASLKGAGIKSSVEFISLTEIQHQRDYLKDHTPKTFTEISTSGQDSIPHTGATFGKSEFNQSTFQ